MKTKRRRGRPVNHPPIRVIETGEIYSSYNEVAEAIGGHRGNVLLCLQGHRRTYKGFTFEYVKSKREAER